MELKLLTQTELDNFVSSQEHSQFLQSYAWGDFQSCLNGQKSLNRRVWRYGVVNNSQIVASASFISIKIGFYKSYFYCPRGPIIAKNLDVDGKNEIVKLFLSKSRDITIQTEKTEEIFFRFEINEPLPILKSGKTQLTKSSQPADTLILNLQPNADELLNSFHPKTRYNIKLAERYKVKIEKLDEYYFEECWNLFIKTGKRDEFGLHSKNYYQKMLELKEIELWVARNDKNDIIAANLMSFYGDTATYLHGSSAYEHRQIMAPHLLQWTLIQEAKKRGFKYYDFHGIAPENQPNHPWAGITRFKKSFSGKTVNYPGTYDFIYQPLSYKLYQILRKLNRLLKI